jgi:hypothetical protein
MLKSRFSKDITFENLKADDKIIIDTQNNQYQFNLTNPTSKTGILSGGQLGNNKYPATFLFTSKGDRQYITNNYLGMDARLIFLINLNNTLTHFCTSQVKHLQLKRDADSWESILKSTPKVA